MEVLKKISDLSFSFRFAIREGFDLVGKSRRVLGQYNEYAADMEVWYHRSSSVAFFLYDDNAFGGRASGLLVYDEAFGWPERATWKKAIQVANRRLVPNTYALYRLGPCDIAELVKKVMEYLDKAKEENDAKT